MFASILEVNKYLSSRDDRTSYTRDDFDDFIEKVKFSFNTPAIHISGTNGKGSTLNYLKNIYTNNGYKVATFTSPYLYRINEMVLLDGKEIQDEVIVDYVNKYQKLFDKYDLTFFEIMTFIGLSYINESKVDLALIEVGMGGEIDATNIFTPILSIITNVSIEHAFFLGRSESEIAASKAGIIKPLIPVLVGPLNEDSLFAIREKARKTKSDVYIVNDYHHEECIDNRLVFDYKDYKGLSLYTCATYQLKNASLAIEATLILKDRFPVSKEKIYEALTFKSLPLRYEIVKDHPLVILDGAHNPGGISSLIESFKYLNKPIHVLFACFRDKNFDTMSAYLAKEVADITLTTFNNPRARNSEDYFLFLEDYKFYDDYKEALINLMNTYPEDIIIVTGSIAFTSTVKKEMFRG